MNKRQTIIFWGLIFMVAYLYAYQILSIRFVPTPRSLPAHAHEARQIPDRLFWLANYAYNVLWFMSIPTVGISQRILPHESYYSDQIYIPFINAFQWFGYGCLFGLWRYKRKLKLALGRKG
jgi:hypothetical protein